MALQDHDFGSQRLWRAYCIARSDGTYDPRNQLPGFVRRFLFVYGSQPSNFFTQHLGAGLFTEEQEYNILRQSADVYQATHWHNSPPHRSTHWPPQPVPDLTTLLETPATQQREAPTDRRSNTAHWQPHHTPPAGWPQFKATSVHTSAWYSKANSAYPTWQYTAQWHPWQSHWSASWDWHGDAWWSGGWSWS